MLEISETPSGILRKDWSAEVGDFAIAGGWALRGNLLIVCDAAGGVYGFNGKSGETLWSHPDVHEGGVLELAIHPEGASFATSGQDGRVLVWSSAGEISHAIDIGKDWVDHLAWSPSGQSLACACSRQVLVFDGEGAEAWRSEDHPSTVSAVVWASADELATACYGRVSFFMLPAGELREKLEWKGSLVSLALSPDGDIVACGSQDNTVHFWRRSTGRDSMMSGYPGKPSALAFDATGGLLATGGAPMVTVWNFKEDGPEGTEPGVLELHKKMITSLSFSNHGSLLASGARDRAAIVWSVRDDGQGVPVGAARVTGVVSSVHWRPDARSLAALDARGTVTVWRVDR
ncbi:MAG: hypothetical protein AAFZ38_08020 [Myxococcota bacterium]